MEQSCCCSWHPLPRWNNEPGERSQACWLFPAFSFLPTRMKAEFLSVSSPPLLTGRESTAPLEKVLLQRYHMHVWTRTTPTRLGKRVVKGMVPRVQSGWMRVLREGNGSQAWENKTVYFFFFFSSLVDLNAPSRSAAFAASQSSHTHTHTHVTKPKIYRYSEKPLSPHHIIKRTPSNF